MGHFEIYNDESGEYHWLFRGDNNEVIADSSESFLNEDSCQRAIEQAKDEGFGSEAEVRSAVEAESSDVSLEGNGDTRADAIKSLTVRGFRGFENVEIKQLSGVNLIVGKNNVGKTALLEAIQLYAYRGFPPVIARMLEARGEVGFERARRRKQGGGKGWPLALRHIFHGRPDLFRKTRQATANNGSLPEMRIGPSESVAAENQSQTDDELLRVVFKDASQTSGLVGRPSYKLLINPEQHEVGDERGFALDSHMDENGSSGGWWDAVIQHETNCVLVPPGGLRDRGSLAQLWDDATFEGRKNEATKALKVIEPDVSGVDFVSPGTDDSRRIAVVHMKDASQPVPLGSLGAGMGQMLHLALAATGSVEGMLLVDEIESGLHHEVQEQMWKLIFDMSARLDVQVFATTHSLDCLRAFRKALKSVRARDVRDESLGTLISLRRHRKRPKDIVAVVADEGEIDTAVGSDIEMR